MYVTSLSPFVGSVLHMCPAVAEGVDLGDALIVPLQMGVEAPEAVCKRLYYGKSD